MSDFPALPGFYKLMFLYLEPFTTFTPIITCSTVGPAYFLHELIPSNEPQPLSLDARTDMGIWQLANAYLLLCLISCFTLRAIRDVVRDPVGQERIIGAMLKGLACADIMHTILTLRGLPPDVRFSPSKWNMMAHGNITFCLGLFVSRMSWFLGIGRKRYFYGQPKEQLKINGINGKHA